MTTAALPAKKDENFYFIRCAKGDQRLMFLMQATNKEQALNQLFHYTLNASWRVVEARMMNPNDVHARLVQMQAKADRQENLIAELSEKSDQQKDLFLTCCFCFQKSEDAAALKNHLGECEKHPVVAQVLAEAALWAEKK